MLDLSDIFGHDGPLERALPDFKVRRQQLRMAERVAAAVEGRETLAVEAGTGTGKTFAYLVPALLSGVRVLISTGTRTLQDQLFSKDLPLVAAALGRPAKVALLKGRSNYLCRYRLASAGAEHEQLALDVSSHAVVPGENMLARIQSWGRTTRLGDLSEVRAIKKVFGGHAYKLAVSSTKSATGHLLGAAGGLESGILALAVRDQILPPTLNLDEPGEECDLDFVPHHARKVEFEYGLTNSFGFGGTNASIAMKRYAGE